MNTHRPLPLVLAICTALALGACARQSAPPQKPEGGSAATSTVATRDEAAKVELGAQRINPPQGVARGWRIQPARRRASSASLFW